MVSKQIFISYADCSNIPPKFAFNFPYVLTICGRVFNIKQHGLMHYNPLFVAFLNIWKTYWMQTKWELLIFLYNLKDLVNCSPFRHIWFISYILGRRSGNGRLYQGGAVIPANPYHLPHVCLSVAVALLAYFRHSLEI